MSQLRVKDSEKNHVKFFRYCLRRKERFREANPNTWIYLYYGQPNHLSIVRAMAPKFALFTKGSKLPLNKGFKNRFELQ